MKKGFYLFLFSFIVTSCAKDELFNESPTSIPESRALESVMPNSDHLTSELQEQRRVNLAILNFIHLENNQYVLKIKPETIKELNISEYFYQKVLTEIKETNKYIENIIAKGESIYLTDIQSEKQIVIQPSSQRNSQDGSISTNGNEFGQDAFYPAYAKNAVRFFCRTNVAMLPIYTCKTESWNTWQARTAVGALGRTTEIDVPLTVSGSNVCATLYFQTSDSYGGTAQWRAIDTNSGN